ncbi:hypothetical protein M0G43_06685 [Subsaxibacter sp. CAU 1640]|uniref:hypothetical protein n=1 Tax=Subsaxibacter sp. CAU 1640 TaxID=2933271 RepID=UPI0020068D62|nr:hypothetical protein [Subsaxibacter sp. CAU 1640]MCK7590251.1 hypothetical protein [Subsaxibacter sp. CAU 1640]
MKKLIYPFLICASISFVRAQVGIGTITPNAQLDIQSSNQANPSNTDGILIPKIDVFPSANPGANQNGMMVYLTTAIGPNQPGFYYWDNTSTSWLPIGGNCNSGWNLNGNSITTGQFIGTTNNQDVIFRRNNRHAGRIGSGELQLRTSFGDNAASSLTSASSISAFGVNALEENTVGSQNNAFGSSALRSNISGQSNSAFGNSALFSNTTGNANVAFGTRALENNRASLNIAMGFEALNGNTTGTGNTAIGHLALNNNITGNHNTAVGINARVLASSNPSNATAIGALARVDASDSMVLGSVDGINGATSTVNVGIGTTIPSRRLHVVNTGSSGGTAFGTAGFVLESDAQVYQQILTPSNRESGILFGNQTSNIRAGILFNSGHTDGLSFRTGGNTTRMAITNAGDMGMGTLAPQAALDIIANDNGVLIPRVILTAANVQAPVVNPTGGALPESTLVYNTNSSGTVPNDVTPGFYYWQTNRWNRLGNENKTRYYTAVGTTNSQYIMGSPASLIPQMTISLVPTGNMVMVNFNASGRLATSNLMPNPNIEGLPVAFRLVLNSTVVTTFFTMANAVTNTGTFAYWDINFNFPLNVVAGANQTVSIEYQPFGSPFSSGDLVQNTITTTNSEVGIPLQHHRVLTVIDP